MWEDHRHMYTPAVTPAITQSDIHLQFASQESSSANATQLNDSASDKIHLQDETMPLISGASLSSRVEPQMASGPWWHFVLFAFVYGIFP